MRAINYSGSLFHIIQSPFLSQTQEQISRNCQNWVLKLTAAHEESAAAKVARMTSTPNNFVPAVPLSVLARDRSRLLELSYMWMERGERAIALNLASEGHCKK